MRKYGKVEGGLRRAKGGGRRKYIANRVVQKQFLFGWAAGAATKLADKIAIGS